MYPDAKVIITQRPVDGSFLPLRSFVPSLASLSFSRRFMYESRTKKVITSLTIPQS